MEVQYRVPTHIPVHPGKSRTFTPSFKATNQVNTCTLKWQELPDFTQTVFEGAGGAVDSMRTLNIYLGHVPSRTTRGWLRHTERMHFPEVHSFIVYSQLSMCGLNIVRWPRHTVPCWPSAWLNVAQSWIESFCIDNAAKVSACLDLSVIICVCSFIYF